MCVSSKTKTIFDIVLTQYVRAITISHLIPYTTGHIFPSTTGLDAPVTSTVTP